jgi:uncharacterized protein (DUF1501 family)
MSSPVSRRRFLQQLGIGTAVVAGGYAVSTWGLGEPLAHAGVLRAGDLGDPHGRTLVIVEMGGGNDGLNTVVRHADGAYHDLRPTLAVADPIDLDGEVGLHPNLAKLAKRFHDDQVAIIDGIGYDDPDLSHFGSFAIWWSAKGGSGTSGWLGAYLDGTVGFDDPLAAVGIGPLPSPALLGQRSFATTIADATGLQPRLPAWVDDGDADRLLHAWSGFAPAKIDPSDVVGQVRRAIDLTGEARTDLSKSLRDAPSAVTPDARGAGGRRAYQDTSVVDSLTLAAELVRSPARPRIIYVNGVGDFDEHEGEATRHPALMTQLDDGIEALFAGLGDRADQVALMTVSEFGRRPAENGSGTDHGTANVHFVVGPKVKGGRYGESPSLAKLDPSGNLVHTSDFRSLYATGLDWLGAESEPVLGESFKPFDVFRTD